MFKGVLRVAKSFGCFGSWNKVCNNSRQNEGLCEERYRSDECDGKRSKDFSTFSKFLIISPFNLSLIPSTNKVSQSEEETHEFTAGFWEAMVMKLCNILSVLSLYSSGLDQSAG